MTLRTKSCRLRQSSFCQLSNVMEMLMIMQMILTLVTLTITSTLAFADCNMKDYNTSNLILAGGNFSGGGDTQCEARLQKIQKNLAEWLNLETEGPRSLELGRIELEKYLTGMCEFVYTQIECTSDKVDVDDIEKTCKFEMKSPKTNMPLITCNIDRVDKTNDNNAYMLLHHEVAGLASLELPKGSQSRYDVVSDQIAEYTITFQETKLGVKKRKKNVLTPVSFYDARNVKKLLVLSDYTLPTETIYLEDGIKQINKTIPAGEFVNVDKSNENNCTLQLSYKKTHFEVKLHQKRRWGQSVHKIDPEIISIECDEDLPSHFGIYQY